MLSDVKLQYLTYLTWPAKAIPFGSYHTVFVVLAMKYECDDFAYGFVRDFVLWYSSQAAFCTPEFNTTIFAAELCAIDS